MHRFDRALLASLVGLLATGGATSATALATRPAATVVEARLFEPVRRDRAAGHAAIALVDRNTRVGLGPFFPDNPFYLDKIGRQAANAQALAAGLLLAARLKLRTRAKKTIHS